MTDNLILVLALKTYKKHLQVGSNSTGNALKDQTIGRIDELQKHFEANKIAIDT